MWPHGDSRADSRQAAVIDVGSNSVRLVIYRLDGRAIWTVYNEKALAGLGRDLPTTGRLSPEGVEIAMTAIRRFRALLDGWRAEDVTAAATAAVREAADGPAFLRRVREETGLVVRTLSGDEEARYAALGVIAGQPDAEGVVGDLGGSSLELVRLKGIAGGGGAEAGATLPLGPFALGAPRPIDHDRICRLVEAALAPHQNRFATQHFHAVGGAWRNLALFQMELVDYPLHVAHQYEMSRADALSVSRLISRQSRASLERMQGLSKKRIETLPYSAVVLEALIEQLGVERITISAFGVREGLLLDAMAPEIRLRDPLIEGCEALAAARGATSELGGALEAWLTPAFSCLTPVFANRDPVLLAAACRLADLGARLHPDHRADLAFEQVLRAPIAGMSHPERAFLASVAFSRHTSAGAPPEAEAVSRVISSERRQRAKALGSAVRLGCDLSGRNPRLLEKSSLAIHDDRVSLSAATGWEDMLLGEQTAKRAQTLASALKLKLELG